MANVLDTPQFILRLFGFASMLIRHSPVKLLHQINLGSLSKSVRPGMKHAIRFNWR